MPRSGKDKSNESMDTDNIILKASNIADNIFKKNGRIHDKCPRQISVFIKVFYAQGIIDNGGLEYFFENDWPGKPPYADFVDAFKEIGCVDSANNIASAAKSFGIDDPQNHIDKRRKYMAENKKRGRISGWPKDIYGHEGVFDALAKYVLLNSELFKFYP